MYTIKLQLIEENSTFNSFKFTVLIWFKLSFTIYWNFLLCWCT